MVNEMKQQMMNRREMIRNSAAFLLAGTVCPSLCLGQEAATPAAAKPVFTPKQLASLDGVIAKISKIKKGYSVADGFFFVTDTHVWHNAGMSRKTIPYLMGKTGVKSLLFGGDLIVANGKKKDVDEMVSFYEKHWIQPIEKLGGNVYSAKGNHDFTVSEGWKTPKGWTYSSKEAAEFLKKSKGNRSGVTNAADPEAAYFYFDRPDVKIRYIVIDTSDTASKNREKPHGVKWTASQTQVEWLADYAFATVPDEYGVILMYHIPFVPIVNYRLPQYDNLQNLIEAYQNRQSVTLYGKERDFTNAKGRVLVNLTGHKHADRQTFHKGLLHVTINCDAQYRDAVLTSPYCRLSNRKKPKDFNCAQAYDIMQIDLKNNLLFATRVGDGHDRVYHTNPIEVKVSETMQFAAKHLTGTIKWVCYDGDFCEFDKKAKTAEEHCKFRNNYATVSDSGLLAATKSGDVLLMAYDENYNKEIFCVSVK